MNIMTYYNAISFLNISIVVLTLMAMCTNRTLENAKKQSAITATLLLLIINITEWIETLVDGNIEFALLIKISKSIELSVTPIVAILCVYTVFSLNERVKEKNIVISMIVMHTVMEIMNIWYPITFTVDEYGYYTIVNYYWVYVVVVVSSVLFLLWKAYKFSKWYQNYNDKLLIAIFLFMTIGVMLQVIDNSIKIGCITVNVASVFIYIYCNHIVTSIDKLTTLLNQYSYHSYLKEIEHPAIVILFDVDDFKKVNDTYGHVAGDRVLEKIGKAIKKCYASNGLCFRIGGDEFCCIITKNIETVNLNDLNSRFISMLEQMREKDEKVPHVSIGTEWHKDAFENITDVIERADNNMYDSKRWSKLYGRNDK